MIHPLGSGYLWWDDHGEADGREEGEVGAVHGHVVQPEEHRPVGVGQASPCLRVPVLQPAQTFSFTKKTFLHVKKLKISVTDKLHYSLFSVVDLSKYIFRIRICNAWIRIWKSPNHGSGRIWILSGHFCGYRKKYVVKQAVNFQILNFFSESLIKFQNP